MLIGVRAANFLVKVLEVDVSKRILWTDSQCVLHWLKTKKPLAVFIENRVKETLMEKDISFQYIVSEQNPADIATRGSVVSEIKQSTLWWHSPPWLQNDRPSWPEWKFSNMDSEDLNQIQSEIRENKETAIIVGVNKQYQKMKSLFGVNENQYSSLRKLLCVPVYVLIFVKQRV